jgi:ureidoacrylate peracid hydrolase
MIQDKNKWLKIDAEPESIEIDCERAAMLIIDMQNAFVKPGGYLDIAGKDLTAVTKIIQPCREIIQKARTQGIMIIFVAMVDKQDMVDAGPHGSPHVLKSGAMRLLSQNPHNKDKFYLEGTWGAEIIEELRPDAEDYVLKKQKYNAFMGTNLEDILKSRGVRFLLFVGTATNICVESTIRHAFFLDYFPILVSDAVSHLGPNVVHEATIYNVQSNFGWVTDSKRLLRAMNNKNTQKSGG